jgi:hypothetical protein
MNDLKGLYEKVTLWANARNLIEGSNAKYQFCKLAEENYEIKTATIQAELVKEIGDYHVVSAIMLEQLGFRVSEYIELIQGFNAHSWDEISGTIGMALAKGKHNDAFIYIVRGMNYANAFLPSGYTIYDAVNAAFSKIEHRKGRMKEGVYIKNGD